MKKTVVLIIVLIQIAISAQAEVFDVELDGSLFILSGDVEVRTHSAIIKKVKVRSLETGDTYLLANGMGWGERPLDTLCRQVTNSEFSFADSYGQVAPADFFLPKKILVLEPNEKGEFSHFNVVKHTQVGVYYENLLCNAKKSDY